MKKFISRAIKSRQMRLSVFGAVLVAVEASFGLFQPFMPGNTYAWIATGLAIGGAIIRTLTTQPWENK